MQQLSGDAPLLATKFFVPPPREKLVPRLRLRDRLAEMRGGRVTLIAAAAGWGKSTLLADWAIAAPGRVAWLSLDAGDDEPRRFLSYLIASLRGAGGIAADDVPETVPSGDEAVRTTATQLLNAITARGAPLSLVLDDFHSIESPAVHEVVQFILDHLPPNLHLVLATRVDPPLALSRLRARGLLLELRGEDLRFNATETGAFLNDAMGLTLSSKAIEELERRTEGWVAGLQMAAISLSGRGGAEEFIHRFSGSNRYVLDYLTDEVLDRQGEEIRRFLLSTSILTRLNASLCDAVMQRDDSERILEQLDGANLFLIPLDDVRYWYRYHHLFATLLQHQLTRMLGAGEIAALHERASSWYLANRMPEPALEHALAAKDLERAADILRTHGLPRTLAGDAASATRWFDAVPKEVISGDLELLLIQTTALIADYQLTRVSETVEAAAKLITDDSPPGQRGAYLGVLGTYERITGKADLGTTHLHNALPLVEPNTFWYSMVSYQLGMNAMLHGNVPGIIAGLAEARAHHTRPDQVIIAVLAQTYTAVAELWGGRPDRAAALAREAFPWIDLTEAVTAGRPLDALPNMVLAEVHLARNELDAARGYANTAAEHGGRGFTIALFESMRTLARVAEAQRDWETASRAAADAMRSIRNVGGYFPWQHAIQTLIHSIVFRRGQATGNREDVQTALRWLESSDILEKLATWEARRVGGLYCDAPLLFAARLRIEGERYDEALRILDEVWGPAVSTERLVVQGNVLVLRALAEARSGRVDAAVETMRRALDLCSGPGYIRVFVEQGPAIQPLVERAAARAENRDFVTRVLASFDAAPKAQPSGAPDALSERELEVLQLVAAGASNQDAARKLFIAPSTVKKHLENIYAKLEVGGRTEAIARARELKLL